MKHILLALGLVGAFTSAQAQVYATGSIGSSRYNLDCAGAPDCDKSGSATKLMLGYAFSPSLAAEIGVLDFGKSRVADPAASLTLQASGFGGGVAFRGDIAPNWVVGARLGVVSMKTKLSATVAGLGSGSDSDTNATLYGGLWLGYRLSPNVTLDLSLDSSEAKYNKNGINETGGVSAVSIGLTVDF